jgi:hypothetical protein
MTDRFDLEQHIMTCWNVVEDIKALNCQMQDVGDMSPDQVANYLLGLETIYQVKFDQMFYVFEKMVQEGKIT